MNEWTKLWKDIEKDGPFDLERMSGLKNELKRQAELMKKKWLISLTLYCLLGIGVTLVGGIIIRDAEEVRYMFFGAVLMIIGFEITVLMKLAYTNTFGSVKTLETLREVQVSIMEQLNKLSQAREGNER